jgi:hypothetical protein
MMTIKIKKIIGMCALNVAAMLLGVVCGGVLHSRTDKGIELSTKATEVQGGALIDEGKSNGLKLTSTKLSAEEYATNGVSAQTESAYTLTASVYPEDAANKVDWTVAFTNEGSEWASGKTVTDYVTVRTATAGAMTAVVENKAAFGEQIQIKVSSRENPDVYATCRVEYLQRTESYSIALNGPDVDVNFDTSGTKKASVRPVFMTTRKATFTVTVKKSAVYTRENTDQATYFTFRPETSFVTAVTEAGLNASEVKSYESTGTELTITNFFDKSYLNAISGSENAKKNKLIDAIDGYGSQNPAYRLSLYTKKDGRLIQNFAVTFDSSALVGNKFIESIGIDETELVY